MIKKYRIDLRLTEEEYQMLVAKKAMLNASTLTETAKVYLFDLNYLDCFSKLLNDINQQIIRVQRQNHVTLKLCDGIMAELSKQGLFPEKVLEFNQEIIDQYIVAAKKEAEEFYN